MRQTNFVVKWDTYVMFPENITLTDFLKLDKKLKMYGKSQHRFVPKEYA